MQLVKKYTSKLQEIQKYSYSKLKNLVHKISRAFGSFQQLQNLLKTDRIDYTFKFSTELIVLSLSLIVIIANAAGAQGLQSMDSNNLLSKELSYHPTLNKGLYNKDTAITTIVSNGGGFIPSAAAEAVLASDQSVIDPQSSDNSPDSIISNNAITRPDPDNIKDLVANQIQNYTVQPGDTLGNLADKFNISQNTIIWANNLNGTTLKPGMTLVILPISGVLHKVTNNDTLPDLAKLYNADINQIISFNALADELDINPGDLIIIPNGTVPAPAPAAKPVAAVKHVIKGKTVYEPVVTLNPGVGHLFPWGECTYYVAFRRAALGGDEAVNWGGNAKQWLANAAAAGARTGNVATPGSIVVTNENRRYGHVALVEQVTDSAILVSEMNYKGKGIIDQRWINFSSGVIRGYIY